MHRNEGSTLLGLGWLEWALGLDAALMGIAFVSSVAIVPAFFHALAAGHDPAAMGIPIAGQAAFLTASLLLGLGILVLAAAGVLSVRSGASDDGPRHARFAPFAVPFFLLALGAFASHLILPREATMIMGAPDEMLPVPAWAVLLRIALCGLVALFSGLTIYASAAGLATGRVLTRLRIGTGLGVLSAVAGAVFGVAAFGETSVDAYVTVLKAHSIAGEGIAILSLAVFILAIRELREDLASRVPADTPAGTSAAAAVP